MERPIIFSAESVGAIQDDRKIQTRRVVKPQPTNENVGIIDQKLADDSGLYMTWLNNPDGGINQDFNAEYWKCPYGQVGDLLWVKEGWYNPNYEPGEFRDPYLTYYKEDRRGEYFLWKWKSARFMPKVYARIWLEVTSVRVERLQDISYQDVRREGLTNIRNFELFGDADHRLKVYQTHFKILWDSIHGKKRYGYGVDPDTGKRYRFEKPSYPWSSNPYVWVVTFKRIER